MKGKSFLSVFALILMIFAVFYSFYSLVPHKISGEDTALNDFSTARAMKLIEKMTGKRHFVGTPYHKEVREFIVRELEKLGLKTEIQKQFELNEKWKGATINHNILARIKGKERGKSLLLLSHYDSAPPASKGASDDAVGVATILEAVRAFLAKGEKPKHDIIILISDGEEIGLVGAKAFLKHHRWAKDVGLVINFEARGSGGPSYTLLETNGGNAKMVREFQKANPGFPVANSFLYSVYKMLPNDTDLTMFREIGDIEGYNFAFIDDFYDYHCVTDNYANVDLNTVEQQGDYLMHLLGYFATKDVDNLKSGGDLVFFNFLNLGVISYSFALVKPVFFLLLLVFFILVFIGVKNKKIKSSNIFKSLALFFISLTLALLIAYFGWKFILVIHPSYKDILHGFPYNGHYYIAGFSFLIISLTTFIYNKLFKNLNIAELLIAPILMWLVVNGIFAFVFPGASFMIIPALCALIVLAIELFFEGYILRKTLIYLMLILPGLILIPPFIDMFPVGLRMNSLPVSAVFLVLLFTLVYPLIKRLGFQKFLALASIVLTVIIFILAEMNSGFNEIRPKPNSINYMNYIDDDKAYWETYTHVIDGWLKGIMGDDLQKGSYNGIENDSKFKINVTYHSEAVKQELPIPDIKISQDIIIDGLHNIEMTITPQRKVNRIDLIVANDVEFGLIEINGIRYSKHNLTYYTDRSNKIISYYFTEPKESMKFRFSYYPEFKPEILMYEISYDLIGNEPLGVGSRPKNLIPQPFIINDAIVNVKKLDF